MPSLHGRISAQELLREAARDNGPLGDIFSQQATQGYYDDALATARLAVADEPTSNPRVQQDELSAFVKDLIVMRAENGDIRGAKDMVKQFGPSALGLRAAKTTLAIAKIQVDRGDLQGALETATPAHADEVMEELGECQIKKGDFDGALKTAEQVNERSAYDLFYDVGSALQEWAMQQRMQEPASDKGDKEQAFDYVGAARAGQRRMHELASHMTDRKRAAEFVEAAGLEIRPLTADGVIQATPCDTTLVDDIHSGKFTEAWAVADQNECGNYSFIAISEYPSNSIEAERELRKRINISPQEYPSNRGEAGREESRRIDMETGFAEITKEAAKEGDVSSALRLLDTCQQVGGGPCLDDVRLVAWAWTLKGRPRVVLTWARSLPISQGRGYALLGIAQALAHPRPNAPN